MRSEETLYIGIVCCFLFFNISTGQKTKLDSLRSPTYIDSLIIDHNRANYSFRLFSNFKSQSFVFDNGNEELKYFPNNRAGVGFGFASRKILIDIAFNIKDRDKEPTNRFDARASFKLKRHYIDYFFQHYKGFNFESSIDNTSTFQSDLISITNGLNYLYLFNDNDYHVGTIRSVISERQDTSFSYGVGAFLLSLYQKSDTAIVNPLFINSEESQGINRLFGMGGGVLSGVNGFFSMGSNLYSSVSINAGIGLMFKELKNEEEVFNSSLPILYQVQTTAAMGYVKDKYYLNLSLDLGFYSVKIFDNTNEIINVSQAKLAFGYKIFK